MTTAPSIPLGTVPSPGELRESGRIAISVVGLVKRGDAAQLHALMGTLSLRELALSLGALGALTNAMADQLDSVCLGQGLPLLANDMLRQWLNSLDGLPLDDGQVHD